MLCRQLIFSKSKFSKHSLVIIIRVSNSLNPDQGLWVNLDLWVQTVCNGFQLSDDTSRQNQAGLHVRGGKHAFETQQIKVLETFLLNNIRKLLLFFVQNFPDPGKTFK